MDKILLKEKSTRVELIISGIGAVACLIFTMALWFSLARYQPIWLLPGAYFLELMITAIVCFLSFIYFFQWAPHLSWIYSGILIVFSMLAGFSVGFLYIPVFLIFMGLSIFSDLKHKKPVMSHFVIFLIAGIIQLGLMLAVVQIYKVFIYH